MVFPPPARSRSIGNLAFAAGVSVLLCASAVAVAEESILDIIEEPGLLEPESAAELTYAEPTGAVRTAHTPLETGTEIERFCTNIADAARDRRYALQAEQLQALQEEIDRRMKLLEEKRAEYEEWLKRREEFLAKADDGIVRIYSGMRADAAAERLAEIEPTLAAGILMKIEPRKAGVILNEMDTKAAAKLTGIMAAASRRTDRT